MSENQLLSIKEEILQRISEIREREKKESEEMQDLYERFIGAGGQADEEFDSSLPCPC